MILLADEDIGTKAPRALKLVGYDARSVVGEGWRGRPDTWWLEKAGNFGWLVFSANKKMLIVPDERQTIIRAKVGVVFLTNGQENAANVLLLLLKKWETLQTLHETTPRPYARFLSPDGRRLTDSYRNLRL